MHERAKCRLHSHDVPYGSGSGQQSVTGSPDVDDSNSCWVISHENLMPKEKSGPGIIWYGKLTMVKAQFWTIQCNLNHGSYSFYGGMLETMLDRHNISYKGLNFALVSCFGGDDRSDAGDFWRLEIEGSGKT
ncbi:hypothetical protein C4D60_Mb06t05310 [Musa balbisiana]|uniref:MIR domain-containing protein n=1 Tax=Musa balbisiana TaxID=52838 RepID=A0A4S8IKR3_MUSBA|nr:hypothetical protein C4D60_Mb06t05310 [Musa balbisiana]